MINKNSRVTTAAWAAFYNNPDTFGTKPEGLSNWYCDDLDMDLYDRLFKDEGNMLIPRDPDQTVEIYRLGGELSWQGDGKPPVRPHYDLADMFIAQENAKAYETVILEVPRDRLDFFKQWCANNGIVIKS